MNFQVHPKEKFYLSKMMIISGMFYLGFTAYIFWMFSAFPALLGSTAVPLVYIGFFMLIGYIGHAFLIGQIKSNGIKVTERQFPEMYNILRTQSVQLGLAKTPEMYVLQSGGVLNAFATRFSRKNFIVLFSDVVDAAYKQGMPAVAFIVGHELGHIKRNHVGGLKNWLIWPARWIPFLSLAYSRACELTCDNIGYNLSPEGSSQGLLILAAGKDLYHKVDVKELLHQGAHDRGFTTWLFEVFCTHPALIRRVEIIDRLSGEQPINKDQDFRSPFTVEADKFRGSATNQFKNDSL